MAHRIGVLAALLCLIVSSPGCLTLTISRIRRGNPIDPAKVARMTRGKTTLPEVLGKLGAPQEVHGHTDGKVLVYRVRGYRASSFGLDAGSFAYFIDLTQILSTLLSNIKFTFEWVHGDEDRLVLVFDRAHVLKGIGFREGIKELPIF